MKKRALLITAALIGLCCMQAYASVADAPRMIVNGQYVSKASDADRDKAVGPTDTVSESSVQDGRADASMDGAAADNESVNADAPKNGTAENDGMSGDIMSDSNVSNNAQGGFDPDRLKLPENASVLITLEGAADSDTGRLKLLERKTDGSGKSSWTELLECTAKYGKNGLYKEKEGDSRTPVGVFRMGVPFGNKPAEDGFPTDYIQADDSLYWNGDSGSASYNKLVSAGTDTGFKKSESEHLVDYGAYYNYCLDIGYNADGTPYKGSAIFLHCVVNNENTHGCVAIPEDAMKTVLRTYRDNATYMVIYDKADVSAVYPK